MFRKGDFLEAAKTLRTVTHRTNLDFSTTFSRMAGADVYLKMENLQKPLVKIIGVEASAD